MHIKSDYIKIGAIVKKASNGLSVCADDSGKELNIAGGKVGDIVVKAKGDGRIAIFKNSVWVDMPASKEEAAKKAINENISTAALAAQIEELKSRVSALEKDKKAAKKTEVSGDGVI